MSWPNHGLPYSAGAFKNSRVLSASMRVRTGALGESNISPFLYKESFISGMISLWIWALFLCKAQAAGHLKKHREAESFPHRFDISYAKAH